MADGFYALHKFRSLEPVVHQGRQVLGPGQLGLVGFEQSRFSPLVHKIVKHGEAFLLQTKPIEFKSLLLLQAVHFLAVDISPPFL